MTSPSCRKRPRRWGTHRPCPSRPEPAQETHADRRGGDAGRRRARAHPRRPSRNGLGAGRAQGCGVWQGPPPLDRNVDFMGNIAPLRLWADLWAKPAHDINAKVGHGQRPTIPIVGLMPPRACRGSAAVPGKDASLCAGVRYASMPTGLVRGPRAPSRPRAGPRLLRLHAGATSGRCRVRGSRRPARAPVRVHTISRNTFTTGSRSVRTTAGRRRRWRRTGSTPPTLASARRVTT